MSAHSLDCQCPACNWERSHPVDFVAPTQGADARPVAIYQARARGDDKWRDVLEGVYDSCRRLHSHKFETRIVYASPRVEAIEDQPIAWGEYDTQIGKRRRLMMASVDKESGCRVRLYDHPERDAAPSDAPNAWADLWYFVMDEAPMEFERIVTTVSPSQWHSEAHKLMRAKYPIAPMEKT